MPTEPGSRGARRPIVAGNWKMNTTVSEGLSLVDALRPRVDQITGIDMVVCPPFISLVPVAERLRGTVLRVGAQNTHQKTHGALTGEVSVAMLAGIVDYVIVGHSERRQFFGETDDDVGAKAAAVVQHGMRPIVCVGESLAEYEANQTEVVISRQVRGGTGSMPPTPDLVVAYEPVWAIGTGRASTGAGANAVCALIRDLIASAWGQDIASQIRIQYGGSVTSANIDEFVRMPDIDGALVGGASLKAEEFATILRIASRSE
ncbi:MAG TPA: triose-phosphate isomerase [Chloroflexota bacterium]|nr:triose-phosphate isomerase [Chloroflexota bacterium]